MCKRSIYIFDDSAKLPASNPLRFRKKLFDSYKNGNN